MAESFWKIPDTSGIKVPLQLMREQAEQINEETRGALRGEIDQLALDTSIIFYFYLVAPTLNHYKVKVLEYAESSRVTLGSDFVIVVAATSAT